MDVVPVPVFFGNWLEKILCTRYFSSNLQTFRPKKKFPVGTLRYNLHKQAQATLHSGLDLKAAVRLPPNENFEDWLAVHSKFAPS